MGVDKETDLAELERHIRDSSLVKQSLLNHTATILQIVDTLEVVTRSGGTIYSCGNGGSACDAMHLTEELVAVYLRDRPGIRAHHLADPGTLTCWSNDRSFETVYERQAATFLTRNDALIGFTTSGNSKNVLRAFEAANKIGAFTIGLLGRGGGAAKDVASISLIVDSDTTSHIQEAHIAIVHMICDRLETRLF